MTSVTRLLLLASVIACSSAQAEAGEGLYQRCLACHQPGGEGIPGVFPPLKDRLAKIVATTEGREYVTMVLTSGLVGTIEIDGQRYIGAMPAQGLTDAEAAEVLNYIISGFSQAGKAEIPKPFGEGEIAAIRARNSGDNAQSAINLRSKVPVLN